MRPARVRARASARRTATRAIGRRESSRAREFVVAFGRCARRRDEFARAKERRRGATTTMMTTVMTTVMTTTARAGTRGRPASGIARRSAYALFSTPSRVGSSAAAARATEAETSGRVGVYDEPETYALAFGFRDFDAEVAFLRECVRKHGAYGARGMGADENRALTSLLELGAGPAWHSVAAASLGVQAVALDASAAMRAHVLSKLQALGDDAPRNIRVVDGDMREIDLEPMTKPEGGFDCATMLLGTAAHLLTQEDAVRCLSAVRRNLKKGGIFVVELEHPWDLFSGDLSRGESDAWDRVDAERGLKVFVEWGREGDNFDIETQVYERTVTLTLMTHDPKDDDESGAPSVKGEVIKTVEEVVACKIFTAPEFVALAAAAGLTSVAVYGDMDTRMPLDDENAHNMVMVFRRDD